MSSRPSSTAFRSTALGSVKSPRKICDGFGMNWTLPNSQSLTEPSESCERPSTSEASGASGAGPVPTDSFVAFRRYFRKDAGHILSFKANFKEGHVASRVEG
jgi:hypothetical protein